MLVATAIAAVLLVTLTSIVSQAMGVSRKTSHSLLAANSAAAAIDLIAADLESLTVTPQDFEFLNFSTESVGVLTNVGRLFIVTASGQDVAGDSDKGQTRAVGYRILNQDPISASGTRPVYGLYRIVVGSRDTFDRFLGQTDLSVPFGSVSSTLDDFIAGNVVDFRVQFYKETNSTTVNGTPEAPQPVRIGGDRTLLGSSVTTNSPLVWAEITLTVLEEQGATLLDDGAIDLGTAKSRFGHQLSRKVALRTPL